MCDQSLDSYLYLLILASAVKFIHLYPSLIINMFCEESELL